MCLVFSGACSHMWSGNCSVLCKVWVLGVFYHCDKVWKGLVTACFMHFFIAQNVSVGWAAAVGTQQRSLF